jgi:hypothetical protein
MSFAAGLRVHAQELNDVSPLLPYATADTSRTSSTTTLTAAAGLSITAEANAERAGRPQDRRRGSDRRKGHVELGRDKAVRYRRVPAFVDQGWRVRPLA